VGNSTILQNLNIIIGEQFCYSSSLVLLNSIFKTTNKNHFAMKAKIYLAAQAELAVLSKPRRAA
jgi:hypothetical protein